VVSTDTQGALVMHLATGDQDSFASSTARAGQPGTRLGSYNYLWSISERAGIASPNYYFPMGNGEKVTGPMTVFDSQVYFATFAPGTTTTACTSGDGRLYGMDFVAKYTPCTAAPAGTGCGGVYSPGFPSPGWIAPSATDASLKGQLIPGVSVRGNAACATTAAVTDVFGGGTYTGTTATAAASYELFMNISTTKGAQGVAGQTGATFRVALAPPKRLTSVNAWAGVME
jgi:hypothetical protein